MADTKHCCTDKGSNPVDIRSGGPGEDEQTRGNKERPNYSRNETVLLLAEAILFVIRHHVEVEVREIKEKCNHNANKT